MKMSFKGATDKPHAVCIPVPVQSHVKAMLQLMFSKAMLQFAKLLHYKGFYITFVNTEFNHKRLLNARGPNALDGFPDFKFEAIPDGLRNSDLNATQELSQVFYSIREMLLPPFLKLLSKLNDTSNSNIPRVSCIISDGFLEFTLTAAETVGVPPVHFFTIPACAMMGFKQCRALKDKGLHPLKDKNQFMISYPNTILEWIPGMKDIRMKDLPRFDPLVDPDDVIINYTMKAVEAVSKSSAIVIHTSDTLEHDVLEALSSLYPPVYAIGPLPLLLDRAPQSLHRSIGCNFLKEETECLEWLNSRENNSVLYVNFGSLTVLKPEQLIEFAWGLANSQHLFLWVIRHDLCMGASNLLPSDFLEETKERCLISSWCPQEEVLKHRSIGGFLTHCGWNSTLESICAGVPMICWPFFGDQYMICRYMCNEWGIGLEIDGDVQRENVEKLVNELMGGIRGERMKTKIMEWKGKIEEATKEDGSSSMNLQKLLHQIVP